MNYNLFIGMNILVWIFLEFRIVLKERKGPNKKDFKNIAVLSFIILFSIAILAILSRVSSLNFDIVNSIWSYVSILVLNMGIIIRQYSIHIMGEYYVATLQIQRRPKLITEGLFKFVRHPCYTGFLIALVGISFVFGNLGVMFSMILLAYLAVLYQVRVEEKELLNYFGSEYEEYCKKTKRFIPYLI